MEWPEITINTPLSEVQEIHKRIWNYAIEHGEKPETPYDMDCALCAYAKQVCLFLHVLTTDDTCAYCPYKDANLTEECLNGLFYKWLFAKPRSKTEKLYANKIRDIEFEDEGYWERRNEYV